MSGPESAGAVPGPACYGQGGTDATVTDANLVLGYLDPDNFLGGRRAARPRRPPSAPSIASPPRSASTGWPRREGIHRVVNTHMAEGVRLVSVRRGVDPRRFALLAFGGAAGLHVTDIARQLGLARVIVPRVAAVLSAWGMLATDLRFEVARTHIGDAGALDGAAVKRLFDEMEAEGMRAAARLVRRAGARRALGRHALWRAGVRDHRAARRRRLVAPPTRCRRSSSAFTAGTRSSTPIAMPDQESVLVNARVAVSGILEDCRASRACRRRRPPRRSGERRIYLDDWVAAPVYRFDALAPAQTIAGPAVDRIGDDDRAAAPRRHGRGDRRKAGSTSRSGRADRRSRTQLQARKPIPAVAGRLR